nr:SCO family protein [Limobrevibacterium gyesilva]
MLSERHRGEGQVASAPPDIGGPFTLVDGSGKQVTDREFRGKYLLVYFGYTYCPDVCPTTLAEVSAALDKLGSKAAQVQPLFITVDPKRDTPEVMKRYTDAFDSRIIGLTGTPEEIAVVAKEYRVYYAADRPGDGRDDYTVDHSSILYLMGRDGEFMAPIRPDESGAEMAAEISRHLR